MEAENSGSGNLIGSRTSGMPGEHNVSPVCVSASFTTTPISPGTRCCIAICSSPRMTYTWPMRSSTFRVELSTWLSDLSVPENTRR